jgi:hypothetical protein
VTKKDGYATASRPPRLGEGDRCPVCGATGGVSEENGTYLCLMCGAPRVLVDGIVQRGGTEKPLLERAKALKLRRSAYAVTAGLALVLGVVSLTFSSVAALLFGAAGAKGIVFGLASLVPLGISVAAWIGTRRSSRAVDEALTEAQVVVAKELISTGAALDATALTRLMHLPAGRAEELFGEAEVARLLDIPDGMPVERLRVSTDEELGAEANPDTSERRQKR